MPTRRADFAGSWYPGSERECRRAIEAFSREGVPCPDLSAQALGGVVPHAGWMFSGKIACNVIQCLTHQPHPDTCIIFGRHQRPGGQNYLMAEGSWDTPIGKLDVDEELTTRLSQVYDFKVETTKTYEQDNTIELQLPFLSYFSPRIKIVPLGLPPMDHSLAIATKAAEISKALGRKTIVLGSTDLTHYGYNYGFTPKGEGDGALSWVRETNDGRIVDLMLSMDGAAVIKEALKSHNACCPGAVGAAIEAAKALGATRAEKILYATSYDVRPDQSFVGYVGILFGA